MRTTLFVAMLCLVSCGCAPSADAPPQINVPIEERPVVAIVSFDDGSIQRQSWWGARWDVGSGLADIVTTVLLERNRFRLVERSLLNQVMAEQDLGASGRVNPQTAVRIGQIIGADYLIMGKVTMFAWDTRGTGGIINLGSIGGIGASRTKARVAVDLRIVDAMTAEILASYEGKGEDSRSSIGVGHSDIGVFAIGSSDFMTSILGTAARNACVNWADNFCRAVDQKKLTLTPKHRPVIHPDGTVMNVEGQTVIANTGKAKGYAVGDQVEIRRKTKELKDPDTGEVLRVLSNLIATGTVVKADEKTADITFTPVSADTQPMDGDLVKYVSSPTSAAG